MMGIKRHQPKEIVTKLRQVEVLVGQGMARIDAIRQISIHQIRQRSRVRCQDRQGLDSCCWCQHRLH